MDRYGGRVTLVYSVTSHQNPDPARRNVHLSSAAPDSVNQGYHKILGLGQKEFPRHPGRCPDPQNCEEDDR